MFSTNFTVDYYKKMIGIDCVIDLYLSKVYLSINDIYQNMMSACNLKGQCNLYNNDIPSIRLAMSKVVPVPPGPKFFFDRDQNFFVYRDRARTRTTILFVERDQTCLVPLMSIPDIVSLGINPIIQ
jgi:hypothetical protein